MQRVHTKKLNNQAHVQMIFLLWISKHDAQLKAQPNATHFLVSVTALCIPWRLEQSSGNRSRSKVVVARATVHRCTVEKTRRKRTRQRAARSPQSYSPMAQCLRFCSTTDRCLPCLSHHRIASKKAPRAAGVSLRLYNPSRAIAMTSYLTHTHMTCMSALL
jgi:hypothetical protein